MIDQIEAKRLSLEEEIREIQLQLQFSGEVRALLDHPLWKLIVDRIRGAEAEQKALLAKEYMGEYALGRRQGFLKATGFFTTLRALDSDEIDRLNAELQNLENDLSVITGHVPRS